MIRRCGPLLVALVLAGCATAPKHSAPLPPPVAPLPAAGSSPAVGATPEPDQPEPSQDARRTPADRLALVEGDSDLIDTERLLSARRRLVADAQSQADACLAEAPEDGVCDYARGIVYGLAAREQPLQAGALLAQMLSSLQKAETRAPAVDHAGPARLQAIVYLRAPAWPLGPGDPEAALAAAKRAVAVDPQFPGNQDILKQAQKAAQQ